MPTPVPSCYYLREANHPLIYGPPTRQPKGLPGEVPLLYPNWHPPCQAQNWGYLKGPSGEPGASRCMGCSSVGAAVREWPRQARRLAAGPGSPLGHPLMAVGRPSSPWEDYNYKSSAEVSGCNPHPVDRGRWKGPLKPSSVGGLGMEGEARCGPAK